MCAYNVRHSKRVDFDPATGSERTLNLVREVGIWIGGLSAMFMVFLLAKRVLFE